MTDGPARAEGDDSSGRFVTGHPVYRKTKEGHWVIVGIEIYSDGKSERRWFTQEEYEYFNPGGKATENHHVLHNKSGTLFNQPTLPFGDGKDKDGNPQHGFNGGVPPLPTAKAYRDNPR